MISGVTLQLSGAKPLIQSINVDGNTLTIIPHKDFVHQFLKRSACTITYNFPIDLKNVPTDILALPFIMSAAPFIWASGEEYTLESIDSDAAFSLEKVHHILKLFYPGNSWSGSLTAHNTVTYNPETRLPEDELILFFSGGLDSMCSSFSHLDKKQLLVTFYGLDVQLKETERWDKVYRWCQDFATHHNRTLIDVSFNFNNNFKGDVASKLVPEIDNYVDWWGQVMLGLCHIGLVTPLAYALGHHTVLMGSSNTIDCPRPLGSHPLIDNNLKCAGIQLVHDGGDMNRPEKVAHIATQAKKYGLKTPAIRVCQTDKQGKNCGKCGFKCLMTVHNILATGQDPATFDFTSDIKTIKKTTRKYFTPGKKLSYGKLWDWKCSQDYARKGLENGTITYEPAVKRYLRWFCTINLESYKEDDGGLFERNRGWWKHLWQQGYAHNDAALFALKPRNR